MKSLLPISAALWPSLGAGPSPLTLGEIHVFDAKRNKHNIRSIGSLQNFAQIEKIASQTNYQNVSMLNWLNNNGIIMIYSLGKMDAVFQLEMTIEGG